MLKTDPWEESEILVETGSLKNKIRRVVGDNGTKFFFSVESNREVKYFKLMNDGSNVDELKAIIKKDTTAIETYSQYQECYELSDYTLVKYSEITNKVIDEKTKLVSVIDPGFYEAAYSDNAGWFLSEIDSSVGDHLDKMSDPIDKFYEKKEVYKDLGMNHKMGVLCYGPPGNGKTMLIRELIKKHIKTRVVIFIDDKLPIGLIKHLKNFDQEYIFILEELTQNLGNDREIAKFLLFLDGENTLNQQLVIATTNYPEHLPPNLANRPGRFDKLIPINDPDRDTRKLYMESIIGTVSEDILDKTDGMSIAYLKEIIISSKINETSLLEEIKVNTERIALIERSFVKPPQNKFGLGQRN